MIDWNTCPSVEFNPELVSGAWVFRGTRVPVVALFENLEDGVTINEFVELFPGVELIHARSVLEHAAKSAMAVWRRRPKGSVIIHSDQGSQFGSDEFSRWCKENRLSPSMSRRGNCWDNAVAESFFSNLKSEKIKKRIYKTRQEARSEVFEYIEGFYNPVRRHKHLDQLSPLEFERRQIAL